jgi:hypothetical protein
LTFIRVQKRPDIYIVITTWGYIETVLDLLRVHEAGRTPFSSLSEGGLDHRRIHTILQRHPEVPGHVSQNQKEIDSKVAD